MKFLLADIPFGEVEGELFDSRLFIHFNYSKEHFKLTDYRKMLDIWTDILLGLKDTGVEAIFTCIHKDDKETNKFQAMFGLLPYEETDQALIYRMGL